MSKVIEPPVEPAAPAAEPDPWILDNEEPRDKKWILGEGEQPAPEAPPAAPVAPAAPPAPGALPGQGFQYTTETGHTFRGNTPDEVLKQMEQAVIRAATMAANSQDEIQRARSGMAHQTGFDRGSSRPEKPAPEPFDPKTYYDLLAATKPMEAHEYMMKHYTGMENPREAITSSWTISQKVRDRFEVADFMTNNLDFPAGPQAAEMLLLRVDSEGVPLTRWNMEVAATKLYAEGALHRVSPAALVAAIPTAPAPAPASRGAGAPPSPRTGGMPEGDRELTEAELMNLPIDQHKAYLRKRGYSV